MIHIKGLLQLIKMRGGLANIPYRGSGRDNFLVCLACSFFFLFFRIDYPY
jgi:hypothetical protein